MSKTHWKKLDNPDYLGAYALEPGKDLTVHIKSVRQEDVFNPSGGQKEQCIVARFEEPDVKPMILNSTNCKTITKIYDTPYIEDWCGKLISIYIAKVKAFGETVDALRIRPFVPATEVYECEQCGAVISNYARKTAAEIVEISKRNTGRVLCIDCQKKFKEEREAANEQG